MRPFPLAGFALAAFLPVLTACLAPAAPAAAAGAAATPPSPGAGASPEASEGEPARQARTKYEHDLEAARQEFEKRLQALRQEYEAKAAAARRAYVAGLKAAQAEETRKGRPEVARAIREAADRAEAEGPPVWPQEVLPAAPPAGAAPARVIPAARGYTFEFNDEKKVRELWKLPDEAKDWQAMNGGLELHGVNNFESRFTWAGDALIQIAVDGHDLFGPPVVHVYGEEIKLPFGQATVTIERKGDEMIAKVNDKPATFRIKESQKAAPTRLDLTFGGAGAFIKGIRITTRELRV